MMQKEERRNSGGGKSLMASRGVGLSTQVEGWPWAGAGRFPLRKEGCQVSDMSLKEFSSHGFCLSREIGSSVIS